jgi:hypothetical protein
VAHAVKVGVLGKITLEPTGKVELAVKLATVIVVGVGLDACAPLTVTFCVRPLENSLRVSPSPRALGIEFTLSVVTAVAPLLIWVVRVVVVWRPS